MTTGLGALFKFPEILGSTTYTLFLENFWTKFGLKVLLTIPSIGANFVIFCWISFSFSYKTSQLRHLKFFTCKHLLSTMILHLNGSCPKNAIISDLSGGISIPKFFVCFVMWILLSVNYALNHLLWLDRLWKIQYVFSYKLIKYCILCKLCSILLLFHSCKCWTLWVIKSSLVNLCD